MQWDYLLNYPLNAGKTKGMTNPKIKAFLVCPSCLDAEGGTPRQSAALGHTKKAPRGCVHVADALPDWMRGIESPASPKASGETNATQQGGETGVDRHWGDKGCQCRPGTCALNLWAWCDLRHGSGARLLGGRLIVRSAIDVLEAHVVSESLGKRNQLLGGIGRNHLALLVMPDVALRAANAISKGCLGNSEPGSDGFYLVHCQILAPLVVWCQAALVYFL